MRNSKNHFFFFSITTGLEPGSTPPAKYQDYSRRKTHSRFQIWLSVLKFHGTGLVDTPTSIKEEKDCRTQLQIWDANIRDPSLCNGYW